MPRGYPAWNWNVTTTPPIMGVHFAGRTRRHSPLLNYGYHQAQLIDLLSEYRRQG
jgi:hypothetical protein